MSPIEEFSQMAPELLQAARSISHSFSLPEQKNLRAELFLAAAGEEAKVRKYHTTELVPFFQHFMATFEKSRVGQSANP